MSYKEYISKFIDTVGATSQQLERFFSQPHVQEILTQAEKLKEDMMKNWQLHNRVEEIKRQHLATVFPNSSQGKPYECRLDRRALEWQDIERFYFEEDKLAQIGLSFNEETSVLSGTPKEAGTHTIKMLFSLKDTPNVYHEREVTLIVNPDPRALWKDIPSNQEEKYAKPDEAKSVYMLDEALGNKRLIIASKRGRSHAHEGKFRDDDYSAQFLGHGWWGIAVSDGAGSSEYSRKGSELACESTIRHAKEMLEREHAVLDELLPLAFSDREQHSAKLLEWRFLNMRAVAHQVFKDLKGFAEDKGHTLKQLHATLAFCLIKKYEAGYAIFSFNVGDSPIVLLQGEQVSLMGTLDVGQYGGGTRFITMPEIFQADDFKERLGVKLVEDFSYLMLMTDGIYDAKFVVESNLTKPESWKNFLRDLQGENESADVIDFTSKGAYAYEQLLKWMNFWVTGNHDDRTLAILYTPTDVVASKDVVQQEQEARLSDVPDMVTAVHSEVSKLEHGSAEDITYPDVVVSSAMPETETRLSGSSDPQPCPRCGGFHTEITEVANDGDITQNDQKEDLSNNNITV